MVSGNALQTLEEMIWVQNGFNFENINIKNGL
jgi:hypothetical protein